MNKNISTFIGCDNEYSESSVVLFGAPFDGTTSFRPGTRFGPSAIRNESIGIETYSPYQDLDLEDIAVFDAGDLEMAFGNPKLALDTIEAFSKKLLKDAKIPFMIGGEHLVTLGSVQAVSERYPDLCIIHFDAHADLREEYMGEKLSHASVMRRIWDLLGDDRIFQFGIRSGEKAEFTWGKNHVHTNKFDFLGLEELVDKLKGRPVYFTLDLDVLDPSIFPGTGTPEAGGVTFNQLLEAIIKLAPLNIVGLDINELSPIYDQSGVSTAVACKLIREILLMIHQK